MTARVRCDAVVVALLQGALLLFAASGAEADARRYSFSTLQGAVVDVSEHQVEGELPLLALDVMPDGNSENPVRVLLGPPDACEEIGFQVEKGDRVRLRVLLAPDGEPVKAQKALNLSRGLMVRFRTMHDVPLWNASGAWQGAPGRAWQGGHRGQGPGPPGASGRGPGGLG